MFFILNFLMTVYWLLLISFVRLGSEATEQVEACRLLPAGWCQWPWPGKIIVRAVAAAPLAHLPDQSLQRRQKEQI